MLKFKHYKMLKKHFPHLHMTQKKTSIIWTIFKTAVISWWCLSWKWPRSFVKYSTKGVVWPVILLAKINPRSSGRCCWINCLLFTGQNWFERISFAKESGLGQQRETNAHFKCIPSCCRFRSFLKNLPRKSFLPTWKSKSFLGTTSLQSRQSVKTRCSSKRKR